MSSISKEGFLILARMVEKYELFRTYEDIMPNKSQDWNTKPINSLEYASMILSMKELLYTTYVKKTYHICQIKFPKKICYIYVDITKIN